MPESVEAYDSYIALQEAFQSDLHARKRELDAQINTVTENLVQARIARHRLIGELSLSTEVS